jgi:PAS domain S-box-containing protein
MITGVGRRGASRWTAVLVAALGLVATAAGVAVVRGQQHRAADRAVTDRTALARSVVSGEVSRYGNSLAVLAAGLSVAPEVTAEAFRRTAEPMVSAGLVGATSISFVVGVPGREVGRAQRMWRGRGATDLVLKPVGAGPEHYFAVFRTTLDGTKATLGADFSALPEPVGALVSARRANGVALSDPYVLLRDRQLPADQQQLSFLLAAPVRASAAADAAVLGWVVIGLRGQDFVRRTLSQVVRDGMSAHVFATTVAGPVEVAATAPTSAPPDLRRETPVAIADRRWTLRVEGVSGQLTGTALPVVVGMAGLALTVLLAGLVLVLVGGRLRAETAVRAGTRELRAAEAGSRRQATVLDTVVTGIADGVTAVDPDGRLILQNPAARRILGARAGGDEVGTTTAYDGYYRPDGTTPYPPARLPLTRSLGGESCDGEEILIRNQEQAGGIVVSMSSRPLRTADGQAVGAVAIVRDITAEYERREALTAFAATVAHDLRAPLGSISTFVAIIGDTVTPYLPPGPAGRAGRAGAAITGTVDRMNGVIADLLGYATSDTGPVRRERVELEPLVAELLAAHTEPARQSGRPVTVRCGNLPAVLGDPRLLRQLLDNLLGNAVKYTPSGHPLDIAVEGFPETGDQVRIEVADRGSGIPPASLPLVFGAFYRAEAALLVPGSGLGLTLCRRIVEGHGGTIHAVPNPGGGTRIVLTLRAAEPATAGPPPAGGTGQIAP